MQWINFSAKNEGIQTINLPYAYIEEYVVSRTTNQYSNDSNGMQIRAAYVEKLSLSTIKFYSVANKPYMFMLLGY